jgi:hypothetical protein
MARWTVHVSMMTRTQMQDTDHIRRALEEVTDSNARYHLRQALQYAVAAETDDDPNADCCRR